jgi:cytidyltransferase-like protein
MRQNYGKKVIMDINVLAMIIQGLRAAGNRIIITTGSWDLLHPGHVRYLIKAREMGDILIVGTDSDRAIKVYKDPSRPMVCEGERTEMLSYLECVSFVTVIDDVDEKGKWQCGLIKDIKADGYVIVRGACSPERIEQLKQYCPEIIEIDRQGETSTSGLIRKAAKESLASILNSM